MQTTIGLQCYHIRYTCSDELQVKIVDFITRNAQKFIISREIASREHIQCYVEMSITKKTWVNKFNEKIKGMDRRDKYVELDKGRTKWYVCKGKSAGPLGHPDVIVKRGFSEAQIIEFHQEYWSKYAVEFKEMEKQINFDENCILLPETKEEKPPKTKKPPFMQQVRTRLLEKYPTLEWKMVHRPIVFKTVLNMLGEFCKALDHIILSRLVYGVLNSLIKADDAEWAKYSYGKAFDSDLAFDLKQIAQQEK